MSSVIKNLDIEDAFPLAHLQQGMIFHSLQHGTQSSSQGSSKKSNSQNSSAGRGGVYHDVLVCKLRVAWQQSAMQHTLNTLVARHPVLRTVFHLSGARPLQIVVKPQSAQFSVQDLQQQNDQQQQQAITQWIQQEREQGIVLDVQDAPQPLPSQLNKSESTLFPWRLTVMLLSPERIALGMSFHHAMWDGWSHGLFMQELLQLYTGLLAQPEHHDLAALAQQICTTTLGPTPPSYKHFIAQETAVLKSDSHRQYWREQFSDAPLPWWSAEELAGETEQEPEQETSGQIVDINFPLPARYSQQIQTLAHLLGVQEKSIWHAAYLSLLSLLNASDDVVGSVVVHGRPEIARSDRTLGLFLNALPVRLNLAGMQWKSLILAAEQSLRDLHQRRHFPVSAVQSETGLDFSASMFNYTSTRQPDRSATTIADSSNSTSAQLPEIEITDGVAETNFKFAFQVTKQEAAAGFSHSTYATHIVHLNSDGSHFNRAFVQRIQACLEQILNNMLFHTSQPINATRNRATKANTAVE